MCMSIRVYIQLLLVTNVPAAPLLLYISYIYIIYIHLQMNMHIFRCVFSCMYMHRFFWWWLYQWLHFCYTFYKYMVYTRTYRYICKLFVYAYRHIYLYRAVISDGRINGSTPLIHILYVWYIYMYTYVYIHICIYSYIYIFRAVIGDESNVCTLVIYIIYIILHIHICVYKYVCIYMYV